MMTRGAAVLICVFLASLLSGCSDDQEKPYFTFAGGGFIFNYRNADMYYGFVLKQNRAPPGGAVIEVDFELPQKGQHDVQQVPARESQLQYTFRTPPLEGVQKDREYVAVVRIIDKGKEIARYTKGFKTDVDPAGLPTEPLVVGPAYQPNPDLPAPQ